MKNNVYQTIENCESCKRKRNQTFSWAHNEPLSSNWPALVCYHGCILERMPRTLNIKLYLLVVTEQYSQIAHPNSTSKEISAQEKNLFIDHCIVPSGSPATYGWLIDRYSYANYLLSSSRYSGLKYIAATDYYPLITDAAEQYIWSIITRLWHYVTNHRKKKGFIFRILTHT